MKEKILPVGICQLKQGYDFEKNLGRALEMIDEAAGNGSKVAVLPEMFITPYEPSSIKKAANFTQTALAELKGRAIDNKIFIVAGSMPFDTGVDRYFNRSVVIDPAGHEVHQHDKIHLFDCNPPGEQQITESDIIMPGDSVGAFNTPWGISSIIVCYDIRFTPLTQVLIDKGVSVLFVPAAFSLATGKAHWEMLVRMRAVELQGVVVGVQPAYNACLGYKPYGHSIVASPWGEVIVDTGEDECVKTANVDLQKIDEIRSMFPLLEHRRKDLYTTTWQGSS